MIRQFSLLRATYREQLQRTEDKYHIEAAQSPAVTFKETAPKSLRKKMSLFYKTNKRQGGENIYRQRAEEEFKTSVF